MNMVAAAKLRSTQNRTERFRLYAEEHARLVGEISKRSSSLASLPLLGSCGDCQKVLLVPFSSERGLCGSFNTNIFYQVDKKIVSIREQGLEPELFLVGRKGREYYQRRKVTINKALVGVMGNFDYLLAQKITEDLMDSYQQGNYKEIWLIFTKFESLSRHTVTVEKFLPLVAEPRSKEVANTTKDLALDYILEPKAEQLLNRLIPRSLSILIFQALLETVTSENAARMQAMDNASKSCKDIIESLTMSFNKARQASVTNELLDIVNGAEALKG
jgi:F-type H+-transporting ATPase subunit gamma